MLVSVGLCVPTNAIVSHKDVGVPTKMSLNLRHRVVSPACIAKEMHLSKSGSNSNSSTGAGYAAAANT